MYNFFQCCHLCKYISYILTSISEWLDHTVSFSWSIFSSLEKLDLKRRRTERIRRERIDSPLTSDMENRRRSRANSQSDPIRRGRGRPKTVGLKKQEDEKGEITAHLYTVGYYRPSSRYCLKMCTTRTILLPCENVRETTASKFDFLSGKANVSETGSETYDIYHVMLLTMLSLKNIKVTCLAQAGKMSRSLEPGVVWLHFYISSIPSQ